MVEIELRPHHISVLIDFKKKKFHLLSDEEYINNFRRKNKDFHSDDFIIYWKKFLENVSGKFKCIFDFDTPCKKCDLRKECENQNSELRKIVDKQDMKSIKLLNLQKNRVYHISEFLK